MCKLTKYWTNVPLMKTSKDVPLMKTDKNVSLMKTGKNLRNILKISENLKENFLKLNRKFVKS